MSLPRRATLGRTVLALLVAATAAACGVPIDDEPRSLSQELPPALMGTPATASTQPPETREVQVFLARQGEEEITIEPVTREVDAAAAHAGAIRAVLSTPLPEESDMGLSTLFGGDTELVETVIEGEILEIRLSSLEGFPENPNSRQFSVAVAMLVCTITESFESISQVLISIPREEDGSFRPIPVRVPDSQEPVENRPVGCEQFASFRTPTA